MASRTYVVLCNCPDRETAHTIAEGLVGDELAACVNVVSGVRSFYRWEGEVQADDEHTLLIKTSADRYPRLQSELQDRHPDDVPEILALPVERGLESYLQWVDDTTRAGDGGS